MKKNKKLSKNKKITIFVVSLFLILAIITSKVRLISPDGGGLLITEKQNKIQLTKSIDGAEISTKTNKCSPGLGMSKGTKREETVTVYVSRNDLITMIEKEDEDLIQDNTGVSKQNLINKLKNVKQNQILEKFVADAYGNKQIGNETYSYEGEIVTEYNSRLWTDKKEGEYWGYMRKLVDDNKSMMIDDDSQKTIKFLLKDFYGSEAGGWSSYFINGNEKEEIFCSNWIS